MDKPNLTSLGQLNPLYPQPYERYLPSAFDENLSLLQKVNKMLEALQSYNTVSNDLIGQWNSLVAYFQSPKWVLESMLGDGAVTNSKLLDGAVGLSKLAPEILANPTTVVGVQASLQNLQNLIDKINKNLNWVSVMDYGAKADGVTDDTAAFQTTLDIAKTQGYVNVVVPKGTYLMDTHAKIYSNTHIIFQDGAKVIKGVNSTKQYIFTIGQDSTKTGYGAGGDAENITIEGGHFEGYMIKNMAISITAHHGKKLVFKNMVFYDAQADSHNFDLSGCSDVLIHNCWFVGFTPVTGAEFREAIQCDVSSNGATSYNFAGGFDGLPTQNVTVQDCKFLPIMDGANIVKKAPNPIGSHSYVQDMWYKNIKFINNVVIDGIPVSDGNSGRWIRFYAVDGLEIRGNKFINTQTTINSAISIQAKVEGTKLQDVGLNPTPTSTLPEQPSKNIVIEENYFTGFSNPSTGDGGIVYLYTHGGCYHEGIRILNNVFQDNWNSSSSAGQNIGQDQIFINYCKDVLVHGNKSKNGRRLLYSSYSMNLRVTNNYTEMLKYLPYSLNNITGLVMTNNILDNCVAGIYVGIATDLIVKDNILRNLTDEASNLYNGYMQFKTITRGLIAGNILENTAGNIFVYGVFVYTTSLDVLIADNIITGLPTDIAFSTSTNINIRRSW